MQLQSSVSLWLDDSDDEARASSQESSPNLADVLSEIEARPRTVPEPGQVDTDDALAPTSARSAAAPC